MASNGSVFGGSFAQQGFDGDQTFLGDDGLPVVFADAVGEGVENTAGAGQGFFLALADEGDHHGGASVCVWGYVNLVGAILIALGE